MLTELQKEVLYLIKNYTYENPITGLDLISKCQWYKDDNKKKGANMRAVINALRTKGYPICSSDSGYFYPRSLPELDRCIASMQGRVSAIQKAVAGMQIGRNNLKNRLIIQQMERYE